MIRFDQDMDGSMEPREDGEWVRYSDHIDAMKRIAGDGEKCQTCGHAAHLGTSCVNVAPSASAQQAIYQCMCTDDDNGREDVWMDVTRLSFEQLSKRHDVRSRIVYAAPAPASPAALTDEQIEAIWQATPTEGIHYIYGEPAKELRIRFARAILAASPADQVDFNPVEVVGVELARVEAGPDPRGVDTLIEALDCTLNAHGFEVRPREAEGERDTARLDWLQEFYDGFHNIDRITAVRGKFNLHTTLRAAIDQSMSATPPAADKE